MRRTAQLKRREVIFAAVLIGIGSAIALGNHIIQELNRQKADERIESHVISIPQGETRLLSSQNETEDGISVPVPWEGTVALCLEKSVRFDSLTEAARAYDIGRRTTDRVDESAPYLICIIHMDNIDATMTSWAVDSQANRLSTSAFDASCFTLNSAQGSWYPTSLHATTDVYPDTLSFPLDPGESTTLTLGFPFDSDIAETDELALYLVTSRIRLNVDPVWE